MLDAPTIEQIRGEMRAASGAPATVLGTGPQHRSVSPARKATQVDVTEAARRPVVDLLAALQPRIEAHFSRRLHAFEAPQFLRYGAGDYFVAHQDGNTPLVHDDSRFRRVSVVLFLSAQAEELVPGTFGGGSLVLYGQAESRLSLSPAPGTLVAFRSETTHEVLPITHGERLSVVSWYRGG